MTNNNNMGALKWVWLAAVVFILDQFTKNLILHNFQLGDQLPVVPFFNLVLAHNYGAAFSFLAQEGGWQRWFFTAIAVAASVMILIWLYRLPRSDKWMAIALTLILGGALGNLFDRVTLGYVVDFLDFYYGNYHYPAFNVADSAITVGAGMVILDIFRSSGKDHVEQ